MRSVEVARRRGLVETCVTCPAVSGSIRFRGQLYGTVWPQSKGEPNFLRGFLTVLASRGPKGHIPVPPILGVLAFFQLFSCVFLPIDILSA